MADKEHQPPPYYHHPQGNQDGQVVLVQQVVGPPPQTNVLLSWLSCFICTPLGIVAIVYANQADRLCRLGDMDGARSKGQVAKRWAIAAFVVGGIITVILVAFIAVFFGWFIPSMQAHQAG